MYLEIVSPEATLFKGDVEAVAVPGVEGSFQVLNFHAPIVSLLEKGTIKIKGNLEVASKHAQKFSKNAQGETLLDIDSGTIEMRDNKVIILAE